MGGLNIKTSFVRSSARITLITRWSLKKEDFSYPNNCQGLYRLSNLFCTLGKLENFIY